MEEKTTKRDISQLEKLPTRLYVGITLTVKKKLLLCCHTDVKKIGFYVKRSRVNCGKSHPYSAAASESSTNNLKPACNKGRGLYKAVEESLVKHSPEKAR